MRFVLVLLTTYTLVIASCSDSKDKDKKIVEPSIEATTSGRTDEEKIKDVLKSYREYTLAEDYEGMVSLVSPALLGKTTKQALITDLRKGLHNDSYDIIIRDMNFDSISRVVEKAGNKYAIAQSSTAASYKLKTDELYEQFCSGFKRDYEGVTCNEKERTVSLEMKEESYIIYDAKDGKWYILSDNNPGAVEKSIPGDVRKELGIVIKDEE